jgi:Xaa-Pro aminopeptidase
MTKLQTLRSALDKWNLDAVVLNRRDSLAWLTDGASFHVVERSELAVAQLLVTRDANTQPVLLAPDNEMPRFIDEEVMPFECRYVTHPWYENGDAQLAALLRDKRVGSDTPRPCALDVLSKLVTLRSVLNSAEQQRYEELGRDAANIVEGICSRVEPGWTERRIEAEVFAACIAQALRPVCVLIAADDRIDKYRHPLPLANAVRSCVMVVLGAERGGLNVSLTRMVHFGAVPVALDRVRTCTLEIHADLLDATRSGRSYKHFFSDMQNAYAHAGHPDGWRAHHQGGPTGYACREAIITPSSDGAMSNGQAFAWNPGLPGAKNEETVLLTASGVRCLTRGDNWPVRVIHRNDADYILADWLVK